MLKQVAWHAGVVVAAGVLVLAVLTRTWSLTLTAVALVWALRRMSRYIPLPRIYREVGLTEEYLMGSATAAHPADGTAD